MKQPRRIAIIGAGPAGSTLACLLAKRGVECHLFDSGSKPSLIVGESLVSAVVPLLRELGIENDIADISQRKTGAALRNDQNLRVDFFFRDFGKKAPDYSYNIPRPEFDSILLTRAETLGANVIKQRAKIICNPAGSEKDIQLDNSSLIAAGLTENQQPDLIIDATGRNRLLSHKLSLPYSKGDREDISYFAHYKNFATDSAAEGQIVLTILKEGWSWQIPLKDKVSVGVVLNKRHAAEYGKSPEERLEAIIEQSEILSASGKKRRRISDVISYKNYQILHERTHGNGWALLGDAFGFSDPMLSPGLYMAMLSAKKMDEYLFSTNNNDSLEPYYQEIHRWHKSWEELIRYFYDGRLLSLYEAGNRVAENSPTISVQRFMRWHIKRVLSSMVSGVKTVSLYNHKMLHHSCEHLIQEKENIQRYAIR